MQRASFFMTEKVTVQYSNAAITSSTAVDLIHCELEVPPPEKANLI